jgi:hypothetical protein
MLMLIIVDHHGECLLLSLRYRPTSDKDVLNFVDTDNKNDRDPADSPQQKDQDGSFRAKNDSIEPFLADLARFVGVLASTLRFGVDGFRSPF